MREGHLVQVYDANAWRARNGPRADPEGRPLGRDRRRWDHDRVPLDQEHLAKISKEHAPQALVVAGGGFLTSMPHDILRLIPQVDIGSSVRRSCPFPRCCAAGCAATRTGSGGARGGVADAPAARTSAAEQPLCRGSRPASVSGVDLFPLDIYFKNSMALFSEEGMLRPPAARRQRELRLLADLPLLLPPRHRRRPRAHDRRRRRARRDVHVTSG
jgi:hypothetical protein